ncbi:exodeoxyribonuclease V subunit beta [Parendozoicomonas haliclonae]|uniref:RecBCD enzyme subunit RecB n=1 Tax=Parendozoicomonas haliclonae TaxID=1960125 RepID=A0A1X7AKL1_9GAMM|nr:exodeoxyribonuclease V subunit beta [Parendozoicomonas haliclonae]SMA47147.1 RecBCD enzyme subunit RecB [Parendozoicomonas haliclonae]
MTDIMTANTHPASETLNALTLPLHGHRLIEASAGTGKTFTIAALYLRLLLGHGASGSAHKEPLTVDQILVVTFTEAATAELRDRVRARIHEARQAFLEGSSKDPIISQLLAELDNHSMQAERLLAAERQMDEAAIFTIHGFCQRMLKQHAFESGTLFTSELMEDQSELITDTVADFWRRTMYPLDIEMAGLVRSIWEKPSKLEKDLIFWLHQQDLQLVNNNIPASFTAIYEQINAIKAVKAQWRDSQQDIHTGLAAVLKKNSKSWKRLEKMSEFAHSDELVPVFSDETSWFCYTPEVLATACAKGKTPPDLEVFRSIAGLNDSDMDLKEALQGMILRDALQDVGSRLIQRRLELRKMSFDDLLTQLDKALQAPTGPILAQQIRDNFRVGLIDEFQDTDAVQYRIFGNIYPVVADTQDYGLFLIGDPKQAIYAFRGADIFTYIHAKHQISHHYTLPTNWRSSQEMIASVNHLFAQAQSPFIYNSDIPFQPVGYSDKASLRGLFVDGERQTAMQLWYTSNGDGNIGKGDYEAAMAEATAEEINRLLTLAKEQRCLTGGSEQEPLAPNEVAVLVRTGTQAEKVRDALVARNIASVYMSDRSSVFDSPEALDISRLLAASLEPTNERKLRAALATPLLALSAQTLDELNNNELHWEEAVEEFNDYHQIWLSRGVLPMLRQLITRRRLAENLLASPNGERRLTNIQHIGELLAAAARERETPHALLRWLQERISSPDTNAKEQQLHLESERDLVQIVTIHKSKGLEYGVVFMPFVCTWRQQDKALFHNDQQQVVADLLNSEESVEIADRERLAEDLRLLYVALTRSVHACYLGLGPVKLRATAKNKDLTDLNKTAFGHLLKPGGPITVPEFRDALDRLEQNCPAITVADLPDSQLPRYQPPADQLPELSARQFTGQITRNWWMTSYSALSRNASHAQAAVTPDASHEQPGLDLEVQGQSQTAVIERPAFTSLLDFPRGAQPGTFLHEIFERVAFENPNPQEIEATIRDLLLINNFDEQWLPVLQEMVQTVIHTPMNDTGMKLSDLTKDGYKPELEFNLPLGLLKAQELNTLLKTQDPLAARAGELNFYDLQGMLKGFIDLTFQHDGCWYVLDWKSNWLGDTTAAYTREAMAEAMIDHRYDLQYLIYTLALHRLLKTRIPDYDYDAHVGGAFYIFLRGVQLNDTGERTGIYYHRPDKSLIEALDSLFHGQKETVTC